MNLSLQQIIIFAVCGVMLAQGCTLMRRPSQPTPLLDIEAPSPNRLRFEGKGAGAGVALMSTMGPMGIAIGVAIDEGIANTLNERLDESKVVLLDLFKRVLTPELSQIHTHHPSAWTLSVEQYGLKTVAGSDRALVTLSARLTDGEHDYSLDWPTKIVEQFAVSPQKSSHLPACLWNDLERVKKEGESLIELWECSLRYYAQSVFPSSK